MFLISLACVSAVLADPSIGGLGIELCFGPALFSPDVWGDFRIIVVDPPAGAAFAVVLYHLAARSCAEKA